MFLLRKNGNEHYWVETANITIGEIYLEVDGFYVFAFTNEFVSGCFSQYFFEFLAKELGALNAEWEETLKGD